MKEAVGDTHGIQAVIDCGKLESAFNQEIECITQTKLQTANYWALSIIHYQLSIVHSPNIRTFIAQCDTSSF